MLFKSSDYSLSYETFFPFDLYHSTDSPITAMKKTDKALIYTSNNYVVLHSDDTEKQVRFDSQVSAIETQSKLILGGDSSGTIRLFNRRKVQLNIFDDHRDRINDLRFTSKHTFASASNDRAVRLFDISRKVAVKSFDDNEDFVNCLFSHDNLLYTGSIDGKVKVYDVRSHENVNEISFTHGINKLCMTEDEGLIVSEKYKIHKIDLRNTGSMQSSYAHMKEVSSMRLHRNIIYTTSHDGTLKTFNSNLKMQSQVKFNDKILSCDIFNDDIFIGLENGNIFNFVKDRIEEKEKPVAATVPPVRYYSDAKDVNIKKIKYDVSKKNEYEKLINNNQHWLAFSGILKETDADIVFGLLTFISSQGGMKKVLLERSEAEIEIVMDFIIDNFFIVDFRMILHDILGIIISMYDEYFINNDNLKERLLFLSELVDDECVYQEGAVLFYSYGEAFLLNHK